MAEEQSITCDGENHYDQDGRFIETCPENGTWPNDKRDIIDESKAGIGDDE